jgi:hypothetical protein
MEDNMHALLSSVLAAADDAATEPAWYTTVAGILAVPAAMITAVGSWYLVKKTRRETRRLDLEIIEKERALGQAQADANVTAVATIVAEPVFAARRAQDVILRFILLYLVSQVWGVVVTIFAAASNGIELATRANRFDADPNVPATVASILISAVPNVGYWLLFVALGWPLLMDLLNVLRISTPAWVNTKQTRRLVGVVAVLAALAQSVAIGGSDLFQF